MTLGGFTSVVRITRSRVSGGFTERGTLRVDADMELEGYLFETPELNTQKVVYVEIEFTETQEIAAKAENEYKSYIGRVQVIEKHELMKNYKNAASDMEMLVRVRITLPIDMFSRLSLWQDKWIKFETVNDIVGSPAEDQTMDSIMALVKRVHFETASDLPQPKKKRRWFGII